VKPKRLLMIGAGRMAEAIFSGLLRQAGSTISTISVTNNNDITKIVGVITTTNFIGYLKENLNLDNKLNAKLLEFLREPRGENIVQELEQEGKLQKDSQRGGQEYEDEQPRQG
jgi:hypothetical protein